MSPDQSQYIGITEDELREMLRLAAQDATAADAFFSKFPYLHALRDGNYLQALNLGITTLMKCRSSDEHAYEQIHKGTPFYWMGTAAFLLHDYETAVFFFDGAVSEDIRAGADPVNHPTPSLRFIQIEGEPPEQAARALVQETQARFEEMIADYNARPGRFSGATGISLDDIRVSFLRPAVMRDHKSWRTLATALISFCLEWDYRNTLMDTRTSPGTVEPFFLHLFKGCVLFESLLKNNPKRSPPASATSLSKILESLHDDLDLPQTLGLGNTSFEAILRDLSGVDDSIQTAIRFTTKTRNTVGHNIGWPVQLEKAQYHRLFRMIASSCLHAIACLYH